MTPSTLQTDSAKAQTIGALEHFGPAAAEDAAPMSTAEAFAFCRRLALGHYENFSVLTRLVPAGLRDDFAAVYAYCRSADDLADETGAGEQARSKSLELLSWWRSRLLSCVRYASEGASIDQPRHPVFIALAETIRTRELRSEPLHHLIDAFEQDQRVTRYETWDQVVDYCARSADPVGRLVLNLGGYPFDDPANSERVRMSDATCTALQLTNFWQDVRRDLEERDRVYLPREETGLDAETLRDWIRRENDPEARAPYIRAVRPLVERTRELFRIGRPLPGSLSPSIRPVVWLLGAGGEATLERIERIGCATLWRRPALGRRKKLTLIMRAALMGWLARGGGS